ncbi:6-carboxytetrahydropterin synthase [bacterium]|nr:6-carboxytetrahydropterin synthase [bacterium]
MKFRYRFEAAHRFVSSSSPACMTPHGHTWYATLHLQSLKNLNADNMVIEFSKVKSFWKTLLSEVFDHSYLCNSQDPLIETILKTNPEARLMRFPGDPTTEMISLLMFHKCDLVLKQSPLAGFVKVSGITVEETPTNSIFCSREFYAENIQNLKEQKSWWTTSEVMSRDFESK